MKTNEDVSSSSVTRSFVRPRRRRIPFHSLISRIASRRLAREFEMRHAHPALKILHDVEKLLIRPRLAFKPVPNLPDVRQRRFRRRRRASRRRRHRSRHRRRHSCASRRRLSSDGRTRPVARPPKRTTVETADRIDRVVSRFVQRTPKGDFTGRVKSFRSITDTHPNGTGGETTARSDSSFSFFAPEPRKHTHTWSVDDVFLCLGGLTRISDSFFSFLLSLGVAWRTAERRARAWGV